ncbi:TIGR02301 family protein [Arvimicrobium flavum]|uniref:TIGR02301 family protein n=1 Tax=Arvimicrobium flavum TaxID=3393320 RepID=UPI00237B2BD1|nr:TIGR02301 family protein [Mesorhizobium shangrilense]
MARTSIILAVLVGLTAAKPAAAVEAAYEQDLLRLAEVLGSLHYLRNLCGESGDAWRKEMEQLLETERPSEARKAKFVASFNRGYRSFETVYSTCTSSAVESIRRYMKEGEALARDVATRYGN